MQRGHETGVNEGGFAAAGCPNHGQETMIVQMSNQLGRQPFAAKEEMGILEFKEVQSLIGEC